MQNETQNSKERSRAFSTVVLLLVVVFFICIAALVGALTAPVSKRHADESIRQSIDMMFDGNAGYEEVTADFRKNGYLNGVEGVVSVYFVKSGTGGEDSYCILSKSAGYDGDVELFVGFSSDGVISGVKARSPLIETQGVIDSAEEEAFLARFGGLASNAEGVKIDGISGATVSSTAAVKAVNGACIAMNNLLGLNEGEEATE